MGGSRTNKRGSRERTNNDLQVPNRPLRRGENLLETWDKAKIAASKKSAKAAGKNSKLKRESSEAMDIATLIGP